MKMELLTAFPSTTPCLIKIILAVAFCALPINGKIEMETKIKNVVNKIFRLINSLNFIGLVILS
jgi:hypothetical protein